MQRSLHFSLTAQLSTGCYKPREVVLAALSQKSTGFRWSLSHKGTVQLLGQSCCAGRERRAGLQWGLCWHREGSRLAEGSWCSWGCEWEALSAQREPLWAWGWGALPSHIPALWPGTSPSQLGFAVLLFMCCVQTWPRWTCLWPVLCPACAGASALPGVPWCGAVLWGQEVWTRRDTARGQHTLCSLAHLKQPLCSFPGPLVGLEHMQPGVASVTEILPGWVQVADLCPTARQWQPQNLGGVLLGKMAQEGLADMIA